MLNFYDFCYERIGIKPISDTVLVQAKFTNLHRELDRNSRYFLQYCKSFDQWLMASRYNKISTYECLFWNNDGTLDVEKSLESVSKIKSPNCGSYISSAWNNGGSHTSDCRAMISKFKPLILEAKSNSITVEDFAKNITNIPKFGDFTAFQFALNFSYFFDDLVITDEVLLGPGSLKGLKLVDKSFDKLLKTKVAKELMLDGIALEHALCEYSKYVHIKNTGKVSRPYKKSSVPLPDLRLPEHYKNYYRNRFDLSEVNPKVLAILLD